MTKETSANNPSSNEQKTIEIVANPAFITWKYPPYCELCNVHFNGESCSKMHFEGQNHKNRLHIYREYQNPKLSLNNSKPFLCDICWKEMNSQKILDTHCTSPAHEKEAKGRFIVQKLKEEYRQLKEANKTK
ncbi:unnamed protein product [Rotaria sp. Silwood1]|nr:unnamed protein product [Rotaria sp. Silwood1]CAF1640659.1 unnamed protein product [Rotaria sp. Silwood1]CAF3966217.1 unnamed protein product [Rotaria sp. Silwood1]CAF5029778.1 unnamed protein product [Rotaria sp. Silwood1]